MRTEVVTSDGEFAYPLIDEAEKGKQGVWIRTSDGDIKYADCTLKLYKLSSFTKKEKEKFRNASESPLEEKQ